MKLFSFLTVFLLSDLATAMKVDLPSAELDRLKWAFPSPTADRGLVCGQPVKFIQTASRCDHVCNTGFCMTVCTPPASPSFLVQAENCGSGPIEIVSTLSWQTVIDPASVSKAGQTWLEEFLSSTDFFILPTGTMTLHAVFPTPLRKSFVDENGDERPIQVIQLFLKYQQPGGSEVGFDLHLQMGKTGVEQILYFGDEHGHDYFFKQWGYVR